MMNISMLEHVNIRTTNMESLAVWYEQVLGLKRGCRPPFNAEGIWLYKNDWPMVHLLYIPERHQSKDKTPAAEQRVEHFAFRAEGLESFLTVLKQHGVRFTTMRVPELRILQVYITDPDGNRMHIDFVPDEADKIFP